MNTIAVLAGIAGYAAFLGLLHVIFTRRSRAQIAADRLFQGRVRKHVRRGVLWS